MKRLLLPVFSLLLGVSLQAQNVALNNDGTSAAASAMLDVKSTNKGFLMPRVTTAQRTAIPTPALGLLVFDTDTKTVWAYDGASWKNLYTSGGGLVLPFTQSVNTPGAAFNITNTGTSIQATSTNTSTAAIRGSNNSTGGFGVYGTTTSSAGTGVYGQTDVGTGVTGFSSNTGVGVKAISTNGLALQVSGNVKIAGGNTNPSDGAVLTSDANGNAVWKANRIGFQGLNINVAFNNIPPNVIRKIVFANEAYDFAGNFSAYAGAAPAPVDASTFTVPVDGVYYFESLLKASVSLPPADVKGFIQVMVNRNGNVFDIATIDAMEEEIPDVANNSSTTYLNFHIATDYLLLTGDKVFIQFMHSNDQSKPAYFFETYKYRFSGRLAVPF